MLPAPLPGPRLVPVGKHQHVVVQMRSLCCSLDGGERHIVTEEGDVLRHRARKKVRVLGHKGDVPVPVVEVEVARLAPVHQKSARRGLAKPEEQLHEGRFAGAGGAYDADDLAARNTERHVA